MEARKFELQQFSCTARYLHSVKSIDTPGDRNFHLSLTCKNDPASPIALSFSKKRGNYSNELYKISLTCFFHPTTIALRVNIIMCFRGCSLPHRDQQIQISNWRISKVSKVNNMNERSSRRERSKFTTAGGWGAL